MSDRRAQRRHAGLIVGENAAEQAGIVGVSEHRLEVEHGVWVVVGQRDADAGQAVAEPARVELLNRSRGPPARFTQTR